MVVRRFQGLAQGFTLIELMIGIVILGILLVIAVPSFSRLLAEQRLRTASSELRNTLALARAEAVNRNESVKVLASSSGWCAVSASNSASNCSSVAGSELLSEQLLVSSVSLSAPTSATEFNSWGRSATCSTYDFSTSAQGSTCRMCLYVETNGRVKGVSSACEGTCPDSSEESVWFGACG